MSHVWLSTLKARPILLKEELHVRSHRGKGGNISDVRQTPLPSPTGLHWVSAHVRRRLPLCGVVRRGNLRRGN